MAGLINLGTYYNRSVRQSREAVLAKRAAGAATMSVFLTAPINASPIEVVIDTASLYVLGYRRVTSPIWWAFPPMQNQPAIPGGASVHVIPLGGEANYRTLGLAAGVTHVIEPRRLLEELWAYTGGHPRDDQRANLLLLVFLVSEAMRFASIQALCYRYISNAKQYFDLAAWHQHDPNAPYPKPDTLTKHSITYTAAAVERVQDWRKLTQANNPDVMMPWIGRG
jgi:hypothetical protein